ncbi:MAG TPA: tRNA pseudouridine(38-40) synthase TruA [Rubricoccaceae bacterium]
MPRLRLLVEYDGTDFQGWQVQRAGPTVQGALEAALAVALRAPVGVVGAGRTDTGVHARGQVAHVDTDADVDPHRLRASLGGLLPPAVAVRAVERAPAAFHARFDAVRRVYHYHVATAPRALDRRTRVGLPTAPDVEAMNRAARSVLGRHDFSAFCRTRSETINRTCTVETARWVPDGRPGDWRFEIAADRFLHGMVRAVVGTLLDVGRGKRPETALADTLATADRRAAGAAAPPHGLVLHHVGYPEPLFVGCA